MIRNDPPCSRIGNHLFFGDNAFTYTFTHNQVNQMVGRAVPSAPPISFTYTSDGGLSSDGTWSYAYDAEDQLSSVTSSSLTNGAIRVLNTYDYRRRRTSKTVQRLYSTIAPPPSPPVGVEEWQTLETRTFVYDDWNLIHETTYTIDGGTTNAAEVQYFWGLDLSDTLQGAGGVGGLLAVSRNGQFYFPTYDNNGNVTKYIDESGNVVAAYEYDDFGRTILQSGPLADFFRHRFSTKYYDPETGLYYYGYRFYSPDWRIWLSCDPIEEVSGVNLSEFCFNDPISVVDILGLENYCHCFDYSVTVMRRDNWTNIFSAHYHEDEVLDGSVVGWSTGKTLWIDRNYVEQVNVTITRKDGDCSCGDGTYEGTNYKPYVTIDGPHSRRTDGKANGEFAWTQRQDISGPKFHDKVISQNVIKRQRGTIMAYKVVITDGFDNVCGTREFVIQY